MILLRLILNRLGMNRQSPAFALDNAMVPKYGPVIYGRSTHYDHCAKVNHPRYIQGLNWVTTAVIRYASPFRKCVAFPFLSRLHAAKDKRPEDEVFRTRIAIAQEMVSCLRQSLGRPFTLVTDARLAANSRMRSAADSIFSA